MGIVYLLHRVIFVLFMIRGTVCLQQNACAWLQFHNFQEDTLSVVHNSFTNLTFWLNTTACKRSDTVYRIKVQTTTYEGSLENEGRLVQVNGGCEVVLRKSVHCISLSGPAAFYKKMNRSHVDIQWIWTWRNNDTEDLITMTKGLNLNVFSPPSVTGMTLDGQEVNDTYLISKGQQVNITCSFDEGNPPVTFRLLDEKRNELSVSGDGTHLVYSLTPPRCNQTWPTVRCEAQGSAKNRSVKFLVRCPPQFTDVSPQVIDPNTENRVALNVKAHTTLVNGCLLIPLKSGGPYSRQVDCSLSGNPPDLLLTLHVQKAESGIEGSWTLAVSNEYGTDHTTVTFGGISNVTETRRVEENSFVNVSYTIHDAEHLPPFPLFAAHVEVCEGNSLTSVCKYYWKKELSTVTAKTQQTGTFCSAERRDASSSTFTFDLQTSHLVRRSLSLMILSLRDHTDSNKVLKPVHFIRFEMLDPPKVTSMTVDGHDIDGNYLINEGQKVNISCSFDRGNPPAVFSLLDKNGKELKRGDDKGRLDHTVTVQCEDDWPIITCEAVGSRKNKSVTFLVRCPPLFVDGFPKVVDHGLNECWSFNIRAHTTAIRRCLLTSSVLEAKSKKDLNCSVTGSPPDLVLTFRLHKEESAKEGNWKLTVYNEKGPSSTTIMFRTSGHDFGADRVLFLCPANAEYLS